MQHDSTPLYPTGSYKEASIVSSSPPPPATRTVMPPSHNKQVQQVLLGPENTVTTCPFCCASVKTAVKYTTTTRTHITALLYCMMCCLCCIGYCSESTKNSDHYCPNCQRYLGTYEK